MIQKRAISPIIAMTLLLVVSIMAVLEFGNWFSNFRDNMITNIELEADYKNDIEILNIVRDKLYVKSNSNYNISSIKIKKYNTECIIAFSKTPPFKYYTFDNINGSNYVYDSSSGAYDAQLIGGFTINHDVLKGNYVTFNGSSQYMSLGDNTFDNQFLNGTISITFKLDPQRLYEDEDLINLEGWVWIRKQYDDGTILALSDGDGSNLVSSGVDVEDGQWHTVVLSWTNNNTSLYLDGVFKDSTLSIDSPKFSTTDRDNVIGGFWDKSVNFMTNSSISEIRMYNSSLSPDEISSSSGLLLTYGFNEIVVPSACNLEINKVYEVCVIYDTVICKNLIKK